MNINNIKERIEYYSNSGCNGKIYAYEYNGNKQINVFEVEDVEYLYDIVESGTEGVYIKLNRELEHNKVNRECIEYGTILKCKGITSHSDEEIDTVILVDNTTGGDLYGCKVLDLSTSQILADYKNIEDFLKNVEIVNIGGNINELLSI